MARDYYQHNQNINFHVDIAKNNIWAIGGITGYEAYYSDMQGFWRQLYDPQGKAPNFITEEEVGLGLPRKYLHWHKDALFSPESLNFWIDFLDTGGGEIDKYSVQNIGRRTKVETSSSTKGVTAIFYRETPEAEFVIMPTESHTLGSLSYTPMFIQKSMKQLFNISSRGKASNERIDELVWNHVCISENITLTCIPLYFLEVNTRVKYMGEDYIVNKITLPVTYNGMMQLSLSKVIKQI